MSQALIRMLFVVIELLTALPAWAAVSIVQDVTLALHVESFPRR